MRRFIWILAVFAGLPAAAQDWQRLTGDRYCSVWPPSENRDCYYVDQAGTEIRFVDDRGGETRGTKLN